MREADRQSNRDAQKLRDQANRIAERVVVKAHKLGGKATAMQHDKLPGVVLANIEDVCAGCLDHEVRKDD